MKIYISSSWKNRDRVRIMAQTLENLGQIVFDFTNEKKRKYPICPPEKYPEQFDPEKHIYSEYILNGDWLSVVNENRYEIEHCDLIILMLPCGIDATADWAYGVGCGKPSLICGNPPKGERSPVHLWANKIFNTDEELIKYLKKIGIN